MYNDPCKAKPEKKERALLFSLRAHSMAGSAIAKSLPHKERERERERERESARESERKPWSSIEWIPSIFVLLVLSRRVTKRGRFSSSSFSPKRTSCFLNLGKEKEIPLDIYNIQAARILTGLYARVRTYDSQLGFATVGSISVRPSVRPYLGTRIRTYIVCTYVGLLIEILFHAVFRTN